MEFLRQILENSQYSVVVALVLGLMTAISPCPLATNISAIGFISRDIDDRKKVFINGLVYTLGRAISYTSLAFILYLGGNKINISRLFQGWGEKLLGPLLIIMGLLLFGFVRIPFPGFNELTEKIENKGKGSYWSALLLGMIFALAFCPYSGVLYFAILIPLSIASISGLYLPVVFAVATGLPVILFAWLIAYAAGRIGALYNQIKAVERWFRWGVALLFILTGVYYLALTLI